MTRSGIITLIATLAIAVAGTAAWRAEVNSSLHRAGEAIARLHQYQTSGAVWYEPRYLEAKKALADITPGASAQSVATLTECFETVKRVRVYRSLSDQNTETIGKWKQLGPKYKKELDNASALGDAINKDLGRFMDQADQCAARAAK